MKKIWNAFEDKWIITDDIGVELEQYIEDLYQTLLADQQLIEELQKTVDELRKITPKNSGRKEKLSVNQKENIRKLRRAGVPLQEIADSYGCSLPLIHKITKDINVDLRKKGSQKAHIRKG